jgi:hypothetical protein
MAKAYRHATPICILLTIVAGMGILIGIYTWRPLFTMAFLIPAIIYEVYRTEGESTKWASRLLLVVFIAEIILIAANVSFDVGSFLAKSEEWVAGYRIPLGDIKVVGPAIMAVLSIILFLRTRGRYTKWLAIVIFITSFAIVYTLDPSIFNRLVRLGIEEGLNQIQ